MTPGAGTAVRLRVLVGPHQGDGCAVLDRDARCAVVSLPGLAGVRRTALDAVPGWVAACVGLGPRPAAAPLGTLVAGRAEADALLSGHPGALAGAPAPWRAALPTSSNEVLAHWTLWTAEYALEIVDTGRCGLWHLHPADPALVAAEGTIGEDLVAIQPTTATQVWRVLCAVFCPDQ